MTTTAGTLRDGAAPQARGQRDFLCAFGRMASELADDRRPVRARPARRRAARQPEARVPPWLGLLSPPRREPVLACLDIRPVAAGQRVVSPGEPLAAWHGVLEGLLLLRHEGEAAASRDAGAAPRAWFGEHLLLARARCDCAVTAAVDSVVAALPAAVFLALLDEEPDFARHVLRLQGARLLALEARLAAPRRLSTNARVACQLAALFLPSEPFGGEFRLRLTQSQLSMFLGLSRQRTNEALQALCALGEVRLEYGAVQVVDPHALMVRVAAGNLR